MLSNEQLRDFADFETLYKMVKDMREDMRFEVNSDMQREQVEKRPFFGDDGEKLGSVGCTMDAQTEKTEVFVTDRAAFERWVAENADSLLYDEVAETVFKYTGEVPDGCDTRTTQNVRKGFVRAYPSKEHKAAIENRFRALLGDAS